jgi:hypothetical protein
MKNDSTSKLKADKVRELISLNFDSRQYFFAKADERWLDWLWKNGLLAEIHKRAPDPTKHTYRTPELDYLNRAADKNAPKVVDIMLEVSSSPEAFNPETIDRFLSICSKLPADQLARMIPKIHGENWVKLMSVFNDPGFEYEKMLTILLNAKDYDNALLLAETILSVRSKGEIKKSPSRVWADNPFYMNALSYTKVFEYLLAVDDAHLERTLAITVKALGETTLLGDRNGEDRAFQIDETYHLFNVDFFMLEPGQGKHYSPRDEVRELAAVAKASIRKLIGNKCADEDFVRRIYDQYIKPLPESRTIWRFQLYVYSLCPEVFKTETREEMFRVFKCKIPGDILSGAEYERLLQACFRTLADADQRAYVSKVIEWFTKSEWPDPGRDILSSILSSLTPGEKQLANKSFGELIPNYTPQTSIGMTYGGAVVSQAPPNTEEEWKKHVPEIVEHLKTDWTPSALIEKYKKDEDFLRPIDADGVADRLKSEMASRQQEFIEHAPLFFDRDTLDPHYTYAFIQKLCDLVREKKLAAGMNFADVFALMNAIAESANTNPFNEKPEDQKGRRWLADWDAVHDAMANLLNEMLGGDNEPPVDFKATRDSFFRLIKYLLGHHDPTPEDEELKTAKSTTTPAGAKGPMVSDPFTMAINSVRGRAFQAMVNFAYRDSQLFPKDRTVKLAPDTRELYEEVLTQEKTRAIMFMFGHYLPSFYFRDRAWMRGLLPQIFPAMPEKHHLYLAAWEGYLVNNLYEDMFFNPEIQQLYARGIALKEEDDPERKHFKEPDEGLATHLALAFMYYGGFDFDHPLFKAFWVDDPKRHGEFVSFLGRMFVSGDNANANELLKNEPRAKERLKAFWDWTLAQYSDRALFVEFGFWINLKKDVFDATWLAAHIKTTLEKTGGALDWDFGLTESLIQLAEAAPKDTLAAMRLRLLEAGVRAKKQRIPFHMDKEWTDAFKILYEDPSTKKATYSLIDDLIREGGSAYWGLKEVL